MQQIELKYVPGYMYKRMSVCCGAMYGVICTSIRRLIIRQAAYKCTKNLHITRYLIFFEEKIWGLLHILFKTKHIFATLYP